MALRAGLSVSSQLGWYGLVLDVKTAFLNAPMAGVSMAQDDEDRKPMKRTILRPPPLLAAAGLAKPDEYYEALKAVYGYRQSPWLWSDYRDMELTQIKVSYKGMSLRLSQLTSEPSMWRITPEDDEGQLMGLLLTYVDDFLILGELGVIEELAHELRKKWETSEPEKVDDHSGVRFLGTESWRKSNGSWYSTQINYTTDLLRRNLGENQSEWTTKKLPMAKEVTPSVTDDLNVANVRRAQKAVGELVWLSTRTRPDTMYCVSKMASLISKDPLLVVELANHLWHFLAGTIHHGLLFQNQKDEKELRVYTDASFNDTCQGCVLVSWGESLLLWKSSRQPAVVVSTPDCELVEIMEGVCSGEAIRVVMEEVLFVKVRSFAFTDSSSALAIVSGDSGSWRTRHLRKRAPALRARVLCADWLIQHLPGKEMPADIGTKILSVEKFEMLKKLMGMVATTFGLVDGVAVPHNSESNLTHMEKTLKLAILIAQIGLAKGHLQSTEESGNHEPPVEPAERDPWSWSSVLMIWLILLIMIVCEMIDVVMGLSWLWSRGRRWLRRSGHQ